MDGGDGCKALDGEKFKGKWVVVTSEGCSASTAAGHGTGGGTAGAIVVAAKGAVEQPSSCGRGVATMISNGDGMTLLATLAKAGGGGINGSFASVRQPGCDFSLFFTVFSSFFTVFSLCFTACFTCFTVCH